LLRRNEEDDKKEEVKGSSRRGEGRKEKGSSRQLSTL